VVEQGLIVRISAEWPPNEGRCLRMNLDKQGVRYRIAAHAVPTLF
jgi:hypothetical protein